MSQKHNRNRTLRVNKIVNLKRKAQQNPFDLKGKKIEPTLIDYKKELSVLEDNLFKDWTWRAKELSELIILLEENENNKVICKTFYLLLYSHWEGYIKNSSKLYLNFVGKTKYKFAELTDNFSAIFIKGLVKELNKSNDSVALCTELKLINNVSELHNIKVTKKLKVNVENAQDKSFINTQDNLSSNVFKNICETTGLGYKDIYDVKKRIIDHDLLHNRNSISHGNIVLDNETSFLEFNNIKKLRDYILLVIETYRDELLYYAVNNCFLKSKTDLRELYTKQLNDKLSKEFERIDKNYSD